MTSSASRRARRTAAKGKKVTGLSKASQQINETLQVLQKIKGLEGSVKTLEDLQKEITHTNKLLEAMVGDLESLNTEMGVQRETILRMLTRFLGPPDGIVREETLREIEEKLRIEVLTTLVSTDGEV